MTSIEPESTLEWPLTPQEWKNNYEIYQKSIKKKLLNKYGWHAKNIYPHNFRKNNTVLNNILLNTKTKPNNKTIKRLETRIQEIEKKISDKQEEIENEEDNEKIIELEYEKELIVSPELLEASKNYLFSVEKAFETFNKHKLGEKALAYSFRPSGPQYNKGEESFYTTLLEREATNTQKSAGKRTKKSRKKKGGKKSRKKKGSKKKKKKTKSRKK
tara:strand:- start:429 stop:1073 length:645 start_codon:yes stop_codon:yes gene_type:complete